MIYKKTIIFLAIFVLLAPGFLPHGFTNGKEAIKNNLVSHAKLCCCGNLANACRDCCCSNDHAGNDNTVGNTVAITACGGTSTDIKTISTLQYDISLFAIVNYLSVTTVTKAIIPEHKYVPLEPPYKPPKSQLLSNFT